MKIQEAIKILEEARYIAENYLQDPLLTDGLNGAIKELEEKK